MTIEALVNTLSDQDFCRAIERCEPPGGAFHHRDHLRLVWGYLQAGDVEAAAARVAETIRRFATHHGAADKYHETLTYAWVRLVAAAMRTAPQVVTFEQFLGQHEHLLDARLPWRYYSEDRLMSPEARHARIDPDLAPLP